MTRFVENALKPALKNKKIDYFLIDSASGISEYNRIAQYVADEQVVVLCPSVETKYALKNFLYPAFLDDSNLDRLIFIVSRIPYELSDLRDSAFSEMKKLIEREGTAVEKVSLKLHSDLHTLLNSRERDIDKRYLTNDESIDVVHLHEDIIKILTVICPDIVKHPKKSIEEQAKDIWEYMFEGAVRYGVLKITYENRLFGLLESGEMQNYDDKKRNVAFKVETFLRFLNDFYKTLETDNPNRGMEIFNKALRNAGFQCGKEFSKSLIKKWSDDDSFDYTKYIHNIERWCEFDTRAGFGKLKLNNKNVIIAENLFIVEPEVTEERDYTSFFAGYVAGVLTMLIDPRNENADLRIRDGISVESVFNVYDKNNPHSDILSLSKSGTLDAIEYKFEVRVTSIC